MEIKNEKIDSPNYSEVFNEYDELRELLYNHYDYNNASESMKKCIDMELSKFFVDGLEEKFLRKDRASVGK